MLARAGFFKHVHGSQTLGLPIVDFVLLATGAYALVGVFSRGSLIWLCREDDGCGDADDASDDGDEDRLFECDEVEDVNHGVSFVCILIPRIAIILGRMSESLKDSNYPWEQIMRKASPEIPKSYRS